MFYSDRGTIEQRIKGARSLRNRALVVIAPATRPILLVSAVWGRRARGEANSLTIGPAWLCPQSGRSQCLTELAAGLFGDRGSSI